jgi:hypothetical protein
VTEECGVQWVDGWGDHRCHRAVGHEQAHRCDCDATISAIALSSRQQDT